MRVSYLAGDLGWDDNQLAGMVKRMTRGQVRSIAQLASRQAYVIIEALKNMFGRQTGKNYHTLRQVQNDMEAKDGQDNRRQIG